jgi:hypothetical protein
VSGKGRRRWSKEMAAAIDFGGVCGGDVKQANLRWLQNRDESGEGAKAGVAAMGAAAKVAGVTRVAAANEAVADRVGWPERKRADAGPPAVTSVVASVVVVVGVVELTVMLVVVADALPSVGKLFSTIAEIGLADGVPSPSIMETLLTQWPSPEKKALPN